jgi:hypothetical protein
VLFRICRKLQDQLEAQQTKASILHQQVGLDHGLSPTSSGAGRLPATNFRHRSLTLTPSGTNPTRGHIPHNVCAPHQQLLQQHAHSAGAMVTLSRDSPTHNLLMRPTPQARARIAPASPTLGAAHTPSDCNGTSLSGRSSSGISGLLAGTGMGQDTSIRRHQVTNIGSDRKVRRRSTAPSPRASCGSLSDLIKSR